MATNDEWEMYRGPCECGKGTFVVIASEPDHPWARASQRTWKTAVECEECAKAYQIEQRGVREFFVVRREDVRKAESVTRALWERKRELMARSSVGATKREVTSYLKSLPTKAEAYRQLKSAGFFLPGTQGTFGRHFQDAATWVEQHVLGVRDLLAAMRLLGRADEPLFKEARALEDAPPPPELTYRPLRELQIPPG